MLPYQSTTWSIWSGGLCHLRQWKGSHTREESSTTVEEKPYQRTVLYGVILSDNRLLLPENQKGVKSGSRNKVYGRITGRVARGPHLSFSLFRFCFLFVGVEVCVLLCLQRIWQRHKLLCFLFTLTIYMQVQGQWLEREIRKSNVTALLQKFYDLHHVRSAPTIKVSFFGLIQLSWYV